MSRCDDGAAASMPQQPKLMCAAFAWTLERHTAGLLQDWAHQHLMQPAVLAALHRVALADLGWWLQVGYYPMGHGSDEGPCVCLVHQAPACCPHSEVRLLVAAAGACTPAAAGVRPLRPQQGHPGQHLPALCSCCRQRSRRPLQHCCCSCNQHGQAANRSCYAQCHQQQQQSSAGPQQQRAVPAGAVHRCHQATCGSCWHSSSGRGVLSACAEAAV